jgi:DNA-binding CsgD family transcriptional regulator
MLRLASSHVHALLECFGQIGAIEEPDGLAPGAMAALQGVVPWESCFWNEVDTRAHRVHRLVEPVDIRMADENQLVERYLHQHPVYSYAQRTGDQTAHTIADFVSANAWRRTDLYNLMYRPRRIESQVSFTFSTRPGQTIGVILNRGRPAFGEAQRTALNLLRPHLLAAGRRLQAMMELRTALAQTEAIIDRLEFGIVALDALGGIAFANRLGRLAIADFFDDRPRRANALPERILGWLAQQRGPAADNLTPQAPLTVERGTRRLCIRLVRVGGERTLLLTERPALVDVARLRDFGLTPREAEVLSWLAQGKSDAEIAAILDARPKTVGKHLERIYSKLGVESRTAVARVLNAAN